MINGINHVAISTGNFERSLDFYRDLLGMAIIFNGYFEGERYDRITAIQNSAGRVALLGIGNVQIELFEFSSPRAKAGDPKRRVCDHGITHICFDVDDIEEEYLRLKQAGVVFHCAPLAFGDKVKATYGRDPDGNVFELVETKMSTMVGVNDN